MKQSTRGCSVFRTPNGQMTEAAGGCALIDETIRNGKRQSIFRSYVYPLMAQPNITVLTGALTTPILFDGRRATGIVFQFQGKGGRSVRARDTVGMARSASRRQYAHVDCRRVGDDTRKMGRGSHYAFLACFVDRQGPIIGPRVRTRSKPFRGFPCAFQNSKRAVGACLGRIPLADFAYRRSSEQPAVLPAELRRACISDPTAYGSDIVSLVSQDASCLLETKLLLILQRAHARYLAKPW